MLAILLHRSSCLAIVKFASLHVAGFSVVVVRVEIVTSEDTPARHATSERVMTTSRKSHHKSSSETAAVDGYTLMFYIILVNRH
jgi:hypothetical protein